MHMHRIQRQGLYGQLREDQQSLVSAHGSRSTFHHNHVSSQFRLEMWRSGDRTIAAANLAPSGSLKAIARIADESTIIPAGRCRCSPEFHRACGYPPRQGSNVLGDAHHSFDYALRVVLPAALPGETFAQRILYRFRQRLPGPLRQFNGKPMHLGIFNVQRPHFFFLPEFYHGGNGKDSRVVQPRENPSIRACTLKHSPPCPGSNEITMPRRLRRRRAHCTHGRPLAQVRRLPRDHLEERSRSHAQRLRQVRPSFSPGCPRPSQTAL